MGNRTWLGTGVRTTDNGRTVDIGAVIGILDKRHTLNKRADPFRYSMKNPDFVAFVERIAQEGPAPQPVLFRKKGLLAKTDPEYRYLADAYPDKVQEEEPALELVYGNRRFYGLHEAVKIWQKTGKLDEMLGDVKPRLIAMYRSLSDDEAEASFVDENANRARTSIYEDQLTIRARLKRGQSWDEIAERMKIPEKEMRRIHTPLNDAHMMVVMAFSEGSINLSQVNRIIKLDLGQQPKALEDPKLLLPTEKKEPRAKRYAVADMPIDPIRKLAEKLQQGDLRKEAMEVLKWIEAVDVR